ncbi:MAG: T9SS type A sorting domain-containing protein [Bacteroidetes bacterium]|nr:T9SS type A sorting domain-containing protein [Bacteroidota bacterium]MDA1336671.1 T9SS type A sorting domain-containing protein [Bacteroidota bacterium]
MKQFVHLILAGFFALSTTTILGQVTITDDGSGTGTTTWTSDNVYLLDGFVFVNDGDVLTIEAGTVIKGKSGSGADASALIVARGGQIQANGTADAPIIFTFESDALDGSTPFNVRGQWGGVILLGNASLNSSPGETQIEGIPDTEPRGLYGGNDDMDSSGSMTYVSIRHGGTDIGAGNEINGLTLGGVGAGTNLDFIEIISNADDGVEFFGGTASIKHVLTAFCGDDSFDYDEGWRGYGQYWCTVQEEGEGDRGGEHDGGTDPEDGMPYAHPVIFNATYVGRGADAGKRALTLRDNAGGEYHNSIFFNWGKGVDIENLASGEDSYERFVANEIAFAGNVFDGCTSLGSEATASDLFKITMGSGWASEADSTDAAAASTAAFQASFAANDNSVMTTGLSYTIEEGSGLLNLVPTSAIDANSSANNDWFDATNYAGAFDPSAECTWLEGWSMISERGFIACTSTGLDELSEANFDIYPNPSNGAVNLSVSTDFFNAQLIITALNGQVVHHSNLNLNAGEQFSLDLGTINTGIYIVTITSADAIVREKMIIE